MGGDFNMVLNRHEISEDHFSKACIDEFKETLDRLNLLGLPLM